MRFESFKKNLFAWNTKKKKPYTAFNVIDSCLQMLIFSEFIIAKFVIDSYDYLCDRLTFNWIKCCIYFSFTSSWFRTLPRSLYCNWLLFLYSWVYRNVLTRLSEFQAESKEFLVERWKGCPLLQRCGIMLYKAQQESWGVQQLAQGARLF